MKFLITHPPTADDLPWEGETSVQAVRARFEDSPDKRGHELVDSPERADIILYLEPQRLRDRPYGELLLQQENVRRFPQKCFAYSYADFFIGFLPGLYVCLTQEHASDPRFGSWSYLLGLPNPFVEAIAGERDQHRPSWLVSFRGAPSAPVRERIFHHAKEWNGETRITEMDGNFFHQVPQEQQELYVREMLDSQFVLCPRGMGCSSHRLFETMALGRVPVILSDAWVEPKGPVWEGCSLRVAEKDTAALPELLRAQQDRSAEMGRNARREWETWFAPQVAVPRFFDRLAELAASQPSKSPDYQQLWRRWKFYEPYGLAPHQKLWKNIRSGDAIGKIVGRLRTG